MATKIKLLSCIFLVVCGLVSCSLAFKFDQQLPDGGSGEDCTDDDGCDDGNDCTTDTCDDGRCLYSPKDSDGDGYVDEGCLGDDCDDEDGNVHPEADELCNGRDDDCDGVCDVSEDLACCQDEIETCETNCGSEGTRVCNSGCQWEAEECVPPAESCNDRDDDCDGDIDETNSLLISGGEGDSVFPVIAWTGSEYGVAWVDQRHSSDRVADGRGDIYFARLDASGVMIDGEVRVTETNDMAGQPSLAWMGAGFGLAYVVSRNAAIDSLTNVRYVPINEAGVVGTEVSLGSSSEISSQRPDLAWAGGEIQRFGIVWDDNRRGFPGIYFNVLTPAGEKGLAGDLQLDTSTGLGAGDAELSWTGSDFGVVWTDFRDTTIHPAVYFALVTPPGEVSLEHAIAGTAARTSTIQPAIAASEDGFGVAYIENEGFNTRVHFVTLDERGAAQDRSTSLGTASVPWATPTVAWSGTNYGLAWREGDANSGEIGAALVSAGGDPRVTIAVTLTGGESAEPVMIWNGTSFAVVWNDNVSGSVPEVYFASELCL